MTREELERYDVFGEPEADAYILKKMLKLLKVNKDFDYDQECKEAKMYISEAQSIKQWLSRNTKPPVNDIFRLLGHLEYKYHDVYLTALQYYLNCYKFY